MERRTALIRLGSVLLLVPAARVLTACGGGDDGGPTPQGGVEPDAGTQPPPDAGTTPQTFTFTSSAEAGHTHQLTLQSTELDDSPAGGITRDTSVDSGHLHRVELSEAELDTIAGGGTVIKTTTLEVGHRHAFTFIRS